MMLVAGLSGCSTTKPDVAESPDAVKDAVMQESTAPEAARKEEKTEDKEDLAAKMRGLERKLTIAKARHEHAMLEMRIQEKASMESIAYAGKDLELAEAKLKQFKEFDALNKMASAKLSLQRAKDSAEEAAEELKQIEIMYEEQDLEDMTAEFVISRGKRNAERQKQSLLIQERAYQALTDFEIPREVDALELEVEKKKNALEKAKVTADSNTLQKRIAIMSAEAGIEDLEDQLKELQQKESSK
jgi:hypothetical protein